MTERKGNNSIKLIALNIVIALLITMLPISAGAANPAYTPEFNYQKSLIINGVEYDASVSRSGNGWSSYYDSDNNVLRLTIDNYSGGAIYSNVDLEIRCADSSTITSSNYGVYSTGDVFLNGPYSSSNLLEVRGGSNHSAAYAEGQLLYGGNLTAIGDNSAALAAKGGVGLRTFWPSRILVGSSADDAAEGNYTDQRYLNIKLIEYKIDLQGNGGVDPAGNSGKTVIAYGTPGWLYLYDFAKTYTNGEKLFLGWTDNGQWTGNYYETDGELQMDDNVWKYNSSTVVSSATLYAMWEDSSHKGIVLNNYHGYNSTPRVSSAYHSGDTVTRMAQTGAKFTLPDQAVGGYKFLGWRDDSSSKLYPAGTAITVTKTMSFTAEFEEFQANVIIDGLEYNALQSQSGSGWSTYYDSYNNVLQIKLDNYNGGAIYSNVDLQIICSDSSAITGIEYGVYSTGNVEISGCYYYSYRPNQMLIVRGGANHSAVFSGGVIRYGGNLTAIGDSAPALAATGEIKENYDWPFRTFVGTSVNDAAIGQYTDQSYLNTRLIEYRVEFNGNGGKDSAGNSSKTVIADGTPGWLYLYDYAKTFTNGSKLFLGWTDNGKWTGKYYRTDEEYYMNTGWINESGLSYSESLYAMWEDPTHKGVVLHNYHDEQHGGVDFHSNGDDVTRMVSKGGSFTLPDQVVGGYKFLGWRDDSSSKLYPAGTVITVTNSMSFTAEFKAQTITIDGEEYDATKNWGSYDKGWYYFAGGSRSQIDVYSNYSGKPIYVNSDVLLILRGDVCGTSGIPAISIDGDLEIEANAQDLFDISVKGGTDAPAIKATGAIKIVVINSDRKVIVRSGGSDIPAIESTSLSLNYVYNDDSDVIAAGTDEDHLNLLPSYSNEPYVELYNGPFRIKRSGLIEAPAAPERSKYSFVGWREATNASVSSANNVWYMPGDTVEAGDGLELEACYVKNQEERAVIFDGQELRTASGSRYYVQLIPVEDAASFVMPECPFDLTSAVFTGYKAEDGSKVYLPGDSYDVQQAKVHRLYVQHLNAYKAKLADGVELRCIPDNKTIEIIISKDFCTENGVSFAVAASYYGAKAYKNALAAFDGENDLNLSFTYSGSDAPICKVFFLDSAFRPVCKNLTHEIVE